MIDLVIRIKLNQAIFMPGFSHFLGNRTINFSMFECLVTCFLRVTVSLLYQLQAVSKINVPIYPCLIISEGRRNCVTFWSAQQRNSVSQETCNINTCENWCWYFSKNLRIVALKLLVLTQFASPNLTIYFDSCTLILSGVAGPLWCWHFKNNCPCAVH